MTIPAPTNPTTPPDAVEVVESGGLTNSLKFASPEEALAGTEAAKMMSPYLTRHVLDNSPAGGGTGYPINDGGDGLEELWSAKYLTESVGDTAEMLNGILGDGDEIAALQGADGDDGLSILHAEHDPAETDGVDGQFFINTVTWYIFGPKASGAWGTGTKIIGENGINGKTILSGTSDPTSEIGSDGDFYFNENSVKIFGPKTSGEWAAGIRLIGLSAYEIAVSNGFSGSEEEWLASLKGNDGNDGAVGPTMIISDNHFFADNAERDSYFSSNPSELVVGTLISIGSGYQQYNGSGWISKTVYIAALGDIIAAIDLINGEEI